MLTTTQKQTAQAIVNIFETSEVLGNYGKVTVRPGDAGHLSFGRSQASLASGNLGKLVQGYCANPNARFGKRLATYLPRFIAHDLSLDDDTQVQNILRTSADDKVMRDAQDRLFDDAFWQPSTRAAELVGITSPLGVAIVYDSTIQGSWATVRDRTQEEAGDIGAIGEQAWVGAYVVTRRAWLAESQSEVTRNSVYRMDEFQRLIDQGCWDLPLPLAVRGATISATALAASPPGCYDGPEPGTRALTLQTPLANGLDVRLLQLGLSDSGADIEADGVFGRNTFEQLKDYQLAQGLPATGAADRALVLRLATYPPV
jgi:chitosanase